MLVGRKEHNGMGSSFYVPHVLTSPSMWCGLYFPTKNFVNSKDYNPPLTLSYSFPEAKQKAKYHPRCRVCNNWFYDKNLWIYKCEKCICYVHLDCATSSGEPFMSNLSIGRGQTVKNFDDVDYPDLLHLPFPDLTYSIPEHLFSKEIRPTTYGIADVSMQHINHQHDLILVNTESIGSTSSKINDLSICHNPMKKTQLLCNGCVRPIMEMSFYTCRANEDEKCNFALHVWCIRLPTKVENHPGHAQYTLVLMSNAPRVSFNTFYCRVCHLW
ncbi:hypothetical protein HanPI659440_Chr00c04g0710971 [Helianthus annuus]|nr:hypothetical protein HanPI659440_Chr00c04g0710971 [Helianthus annuus]